MGDEWYYNGSPPPVDYSYMSPTNVNGVQYTSGPDGRAYVIDPTTGAQTLASQDQIKAYNSVYGSVYDVNDYAPPAPERPKLDAFKQFRTNHPNYTPRRQAPTGNFGLGGGMDNGLQNNFQRAASEGTFAQKPRNSIVKSLMRGR